jgi:hypothetical protein
MRNFFLGLLTVLVFIIFIPFVAGLIVHIGNLHYLIAVVSGILLLTGFWTIVRGRVGVGVLLLILSIIIFLLFNDLEIMDLWY